MRLIDADALLKNIRRAVYPDDLATTIAVGICESHVKDMPTVDATLVVRCKDCRYYNTNYCGDGFGWCERNGIGHGTSDDWFCADGERVDSPTCGPDYCEIGGGDEGAIRPMVFIPKAKLRYDKGLKKAYMDVSVEKQYLVCCKDCKKWEKDQPALDELTDTHTCGLHLIFTKPYDYCSYAEALNNADGETPLSR